MKIAMETVKAIDHKKTGELVRNEREKKGISMFRVADAVGISSPYLSELERGRRNWTPELFTRVKRAIATA